VSEHETFEAIASVVATCEEQIAELRRLEIVLCRQRETIVARDVEALLATIAEQAQRLESLQRADAARARAGATLARALGLPCGDATLRELAAALDSGPAARLREVAAAAGAALAAIERVNADNRRLIQDSLAFVESMLAALAGRASTSRTYGESGDLVHAQLDMLVDHSA